MIFKFVCNLFNLYREKNNLPAGSKDKAAHKFEPDDPAWSTEEESDAEVWQAPENRPKSSDMVHNVFNSIFVFFYRNVFVLNSSLEDCII